MTSTIKTKKIISTGILLFLISLSLYSQKQKVWNKQLYDAYPFHYGLAIGLNSMNMTTINSDTFYTIDTVHAIEAGAQPGFSILMVGNLRLGDNFDLRFTPGLIFGQRHLYYQLRDFSSAPDTSLYEHTMRIESTFASFPILLKYRAVRLNNYRPYLIAGVNYCFDLESEKRIRDEEKPKIRLTRSDLYVELGFGLDYYFPYFKFSTELKFSLGLLNILRRDGTEYTQALERVNSRFVSLLFYFE